MLDIYNQMKAEKMHSGVSLALVPRDGGAGSARLRGLTEGQEQLSLPSSPKTQHLTSLRGWGCRWSQGKDMVGWSPKGRDGLTSLESLSRKQATILLGTNKAWLEAQTWMCHTSGRARSKHSSGELL